MTVREQSRSTGATGLVAAGFAGLITPQLCRTASVSNLAYGYIGKRPRV